MSKRRKNPSRPSAPAYRIPSRAPGADCPFDPQTAARLAARPVDPRRRLPVPAMNGDGDFLTLDPGVVMRLAAARECAVCGQRIVNGEYAFLSGPDAAGHRVTRNPPAHEGCLHAALVLCPYISHERTRRAAGDRAAALDDDPRQDLGKPQVWILGIAASYHIETDGGHAVHVRPAPWLRHNRYRYADGRLAPAAW